VTGPAELTPQTLAEWLAPEWRVDQPAFGGFHLFDIYRLGDDDRMVVELVDGGEVVRLVVRSNMTERAHRVVGGLALSYDPGANPEASAAASDALAELLAVKLGPDERRFHVPEGAELRVPEAIAAEVRTDAAQLTDDPDASLVRVDFAHYERLFGSRGTPLRVSRSGNNPVGISLHYPAPINGSLATSGVLYRMPTRFHRRRFRRYFAALGCAYEDGFMRTVPSPATFRQRAREVLGHEPPLSPKLMRGFRGSISAFAWGRSVTDHAVLPVCVAPRWAVEVHRVLRRVHSARLNDIPVDVGMLAHDVSLHTVGLHAVDPALFRELRADARLHLSDVPTGHAARVASFFEDTLTRAAWDAWKEVEAPSEFRTHFSARAADLQAALPRRFARRRPSLRRTGGPRSAHPGRPATGERR
jgi:hypothetical protein